MRDGIDDDVGEVVIDQPVENLSAAALAADDTRRLQHSKMLTDQWLRDTEGAHQFVYAPLRFAELEDNRDSDGCGECAQDVTRRAQCLA
ncbi:hypothetical protein BFN03_10270 [Rhodococcus sp. WMMA185]|nr:hypothetical protein BFN03_10270 [Rhodococcus sp. WMMA185]